MTEQVYLNGKLVPAEKATVSVFDAGLQHGVGLFEAIRCYGGKPFRLGDHIGRLNNSAADLGMIVDVKLEQFAEAVGDLLRANELSDARVRITVTGGSVRVGMHEGAMNTPTTLITAGPAQSPPEQCYADGVGVLLSDYRLSDKDPIVRHKTICYMQRLAALKVAQKAQLADALWLTGDGYLASGSISNVFMVRDDILLTPSLDLPIVPGIARKIFIEASKEIGIRVQEGKFTLEDVLSAQQLFLTNSAVEVLPVVAIERHDVGSGQVGATTEKLFQGYRAKVHEELKLS